MRYDPLSAPTATNWGTSASSLPACSTTVTTGCFPGYQGFSDANYQSYQNSKDHHSDVRPGFTLGGPLLPFLSSAWRDKVFFFVGFNPDLSRDARSVNYGPASAGNPATGVIPFSQNTNTYYTTARVDVLASKKVRVFGSWLYQLQKQYGEALPFADSSTPYNFSTGTGQFNLSSGNAPFVYGHGLGYTAPNITVNTGADYTISPSVVSTSRFGYYFENYHDFGYPRSPTDSSMSWETNGFGQVAGALTARPLAQVTNYNSSKAIEFSQDIAWFKSTKFGNNNFKFGYQLNRNSNDIQQLYNEPYIQLFPGRVTIPAVRLARQTARLLLGSIRPRGRIPVAKVSVEMVTLPSLIRVLLAMQSPITMVSMARIHGQSDAESLSMPASASKRNSSLVRQLATAHLRNQSTSVGRTRLLPVLV